MKPVTFTPERWYMIWNAMLGLALIGLARVVLVNPILSRLDALVNK